MVNGDTYKHSSFSQVKNLNKVNGVISKRSMRPSQMVKAYNPYVKMVMPRSSIGV